MSCLTSKGNWRRHRRRMIASLAPATSLFPPLRMRLRKRLRSIAQNGEGRASNRKKRKERWLDRVFVSISNLSNSTVFSRPTPNLNGIRKNLFRHFRVRSVAKEQTELYLPLRMEIGRDRPLERPLVRFFHW